MYSVCYDMQFWGTKYVYPFDNLLVFYINLFYLKLPEDDLKKSKRVGVLINRMWK